MNADFDVITQMLEQKKALLLKKINRAYNEHIEKSHKFCEGLKSYLSSAEKLLTPEVKLDLELKDINECLKSRIKEFESDIDIKITREDLELDLINSRFVEPPTEIIDKVLTRYDFFPIQKTYLTHIQSLFKASRIIRPSMVDA